MARRKLPKRPTADTLRVGHTVYAVLFYGRPQPGTFRVMSYRLTAGPACRRAEDVRPGVVPLAEMRAGILWCEGMAVDPRLFWTRRQAQRCADQVLRDYLRGACDGRALSRG